MMRSWRAILGVVFLCHSQCVVTRGREVPYRVSAMNYPPLHSLPRGVRGPTLVPEPPRLKWNWDHIPLSFHGAVRGREFTPEEVAHLAKFQMITIEKWYTPCASQGPTQSGPECAVEQKIEDLFRRVREINDRTTTIMYWNSMLDFSFYKAHSAMEQLESAGYHAYLRDERGELVVLCNDGDVYCGLTTFDWTKRLVRSLWLKTVYGFIKSGVVDGVFADHSGKWGNGIGIGTGKRGDAPNQLCNGVGSRRKCFNFTDDFRDSFNSWHNWVTNFTQDLLSKTTGGPVIQGPYAVMRGLDPCNFRLLRKAILNKATPIIEAWQCQPSRSCLAAYLAAVEPGIYLHCLYNGPALIESTYFPEMNYPLGPPDGPAVEVPMGSGVWKRRFASGVIATWNDNDMVGDVDFPGHPREAREPEEVLLCEPTMVRTTKLEDKTFGLYNLARRDGVETAMLCCSFCAMTRGCTKWAWHVGDGNVCHAHGHQARGPRRKPGIVAGELLLTQA